MRAWVLIATFVGALGCTSTTPLPRKAIDLNREGASALAAGFLEIAAARIALALEYSPRFTEAWVNLGLVEERRGNFDMARRDFVKARDLNPDLPAPHHALGLLAERQGHMEEAEKYYRAALKVDPGFSPARTNLARRLFERAAWEEAREQFLRLTQVSPGTLAGWTGLAETLLRIGRASEAESVVDQARSTFGPVPSVVLLEARLLMRRNAFALAEDRLEPVTHASDQRFAAAALAWTAVARIGLGALEGALAAAEDAVALEPDDEVARYALRVARQARSR